MRSSFIIPTAKHLQGISDNPAKLFPNYAPHSLLLAALLYNRERGMSKRNLLKIQIIMGAAYVMGCKAQGR
jgi:hypothetical protein